MRRRLFGIFIKGEAKCFRRFHTAKQAVQAANLYRKNEIEVLVKHFNEDGKTECPGCEECLPARP